MARQIARRTVLRAGVAAAGMLVARRAYAQHLLPDYADGRPSYNTLLGNPPLLGRVETWSWEFRQVVAEPGRLGHPLRVTGYREIVPIYRAVHAEPPSELFRHNDVWFDVGDGAMYSSYVVPVREVFNTPEETLGEGFWGEISVPFTWQHVQPMPRYRGRYALAYGTVHRVVERVNDAEGRAWYRLLDDRQVKAWWVEATHVRRIRPEEFAPISPEVPAGARRIEIDLSAQKLACIENDLPVFSTRIASGTAYFSPSGQRYGFTTPPGVHHVMHKRPTRHMNGGDRDNPAQYYDLPGVPWCTYFVTGGGAIHGTYWHNDFGRPRSHGCINVPLDAARWIFRWVTPVTAYQNDYPWTNYRVEDATTIIVS